MSCKHENGQVANVHMVGYGSGWNMICTDCGKTLTKLTITNKVPSKYIPKDLARFM